MSSDEEETGGIASSTWGPQSKKSFRSAKRQFGLFLKWLAENYPDIAAAIFPGGVPNKPTYRAAKKEKITNKVMDLFGRWLFDHARNLKDPTRTQKISFESASRYFSSIKTGIIRHFFTQPSKCSLDESSLKKIRDGMVNEFIMRVMKDNTSLSKSHEDASVEDLLRITALCLWDNTFEGANLAFYVIALYQLAGRGAEVAVLPFRRLSMYQPEEFATTGARPGSDLVGRIKVWRTKLRKEQDLTVFPDRDNFLRCFYFLMFYSMVMNEDPTPTESMFPTFVSKSKTRVIGDAREAVEDARAIVEEELLANEEEMQRDGIKETAEAKGVSKYFKDMLKRLGKYAQYLEELEFDDDDVDDDDDGPRTATSQPHESTFTPSGGLEFNPNLSAHSQKRCQVNLANSHGLLKTTWVCFRAGWLMKAVHSIFDYLTPSAADDRQVGLVNSGFTAVVGGKYVGGHPPELNALVGDEDFDKIDAFRQNLFCSYENVEAASDRNLQGLLLATGLLRLPHFILFLKEHPKPNAGRGFGLTDESCYMKHRFLQRLKNAATRAGIEDPEAAFQRWSDKIEKDFHRRNFMAMPFSDILRTQGSEPFHCDPRSLADTLDSHGSELAAMSARLLEIERNQRAQAADNLIAKQKQQEMEQNQQQILQNQGKIYDLLLSIAGQQENGNGIQVVSRRNNIDAPGAAANTTPDEPMRNAVPGHEPLPASLKGLTVKKLFIAWHVNGYYCAPRQQRKNSRQSFNDAKFCIEYFTLFFDSHIPPLPPGIVHGQAPEAAAWRNALQQKTNAAWRRVEAFWLSQEGNSDTTGLHDSLSFFKAWMYQLDSENWPRGPSGNTAFQSSDIKMRNRSQLAQHQKTEKEKQQKKRAKKRSRDQAMQELDESARASDRSNDDGEVERQHV